MEELLGLDRKTYGINISPPKYDAKGDVVKPEAKYSLRQDDVKSRASIDAFFAAFSDEGSQLEKDIFPGDGGCRLEMTQTETNRKVTLALTYSGTEYSAKVVLGTDVMSVKESQEKLVDRIKDYLNGRADSKMRRREKPARSAIQDDTVFGVQLAPEKYEDWALEFE